MAVKLTPKQLEGLDLLIAAKQLNPEFVNWVDVVQVTVDVVAVTVGASATHVNTKEVVQALGELQKLSVDKLIELRKQH